MRLALITHVLGFREGQGRVNYEVARAGLDAGLHITAVAESCAADLRDHPRMEFIQVSKSRLPTRVLKNLSFALRSTLRLARRMHRFDLIQVNGFSTFVKGDIVAAHFVHSAWAKNAHYPFHLSSMKPYELYQCFYTTFNAWWEKKIYRKAKKIIAVSRKTARELVELGVDPSVITVIYNGVDVDTFRPGAPERPYFGLPENVPLALFVGDLRTPRKNLGTLLHAMRLLPQMRLVVAGATAGSPFPSLAQELGISERVFFLGATGEVARLMRSVDLFVFPSRYEAHPLVLMEAMASGLPVVVSENVAAGEDFASCTLTIDPENVSALASSISKLLQSPEEMKALGASARECAIRMRWATMAAQYLRVYAEAKGSPTAPAVA